MAKTSVTVYKPRSAIIIDGANTYSCARAFGLDVDYRRLEEWARARSQHVRSYYFTTVNDDEDGYSSIRPLLDWLDYNGYTVVTQPLRDHTDESGNRRLRGTIDILLTIAALKIAPTLEELVLFSGSANFAPLVQAVQEIGVRVIVVSSIDSQSPFASNELRRQADEFWDLADLLKIFGKERVRKA